MSETEIILAVKVCVCVCVSICRLSDGQMSRESGRGLLQYMRGYGGCFFSPTHSLALRAFEKAEISECEYLQTDEIG